MLGDPQSLNQYQCAIQNPLRYIDPLGTEEGPAYGTPEYWEGEAEWWEARPASFIGWLTGRNEFNRNYAETLREEADAARKRARAARKAREAAQQGLSVHRRILPPSDPDQEPSMGLRSVGGPRIPEIAITPDVGGPPRSKREMPGRKLPKVQQQQREEPIIVGENVIYSVPGIEIAVPITLEESLAHLYGKR